MKTDGQLPANTKVRTAGRLALRAAGAALPVIINN
jgi:hypothetical protein